MNGIVILGCGASFRSGFLRNSPSLDFDNLAHMWLMPINTTARGQTPGDIGPFFLTTGSMQALLPSSSSYQLDLSNMHTQRKTQIQSICILWDLQKHLLF